MKYYSEITQEMYDTEAELKQAEQHNKDELLSYIFDTYEDFMSLIKEYHEIYSDETLIIPGIRINEKGAFFVSPQVNNDNRFAGYYEDIDYMIDTIAKNNPREIDDNDNDKNSIKPNNSPSFKEPTFSARLSDEAKEALEKLIGTF